LHQGREPHPPGRTYVACTRGRRTNEANWVKLQIAIFTGEAVTFSLVDTGGNTVMIDDCVVADPPQYGYVKALLSPLDLGNGRHVDCAEGFEDNTP